MLPNLYLHAAPSAAPVNVTTVTPSSTEIIVLWSEVPAIDQNGIIIEYEVEYTQNTFDITNQTRTVNTTMILLTSLEEYVQYYIRVRAYTIIGSGPYSDVVNETTLEDSRLKLYTFNM